MVSKTTKTLRIKPRSSLKATNYFYSPPEYKFSRPRLVLIDALNLSTPFRSSPQRMILLESCMSYTLASNLIK